MGIYVETRIRGSLEEVWEKTQNPAQHERWDVRFSTIAYLERASEDEPQRFRYATRLGFGKEIVGWGETVGKSEGERSRSSALRFGSDSPLSLIREGSGYWKYEPTADGLRFVTAYDYRVRWGACGRLFDRLVFRPLMGRATAWSFDRLRLWIERRVDPREAALRTAVHALATAAIAFTWAWHGLVPKLLGPHPDELALLMDGGLSAGAAAHGVQVLGVLELVFGLAFPFLARRRWPWVLTLLAMVAATFHVVFLSPRFLDDAFDPLTLNVLMAALALAGLLANRDLPDAGHCLRRAPERP